MAFLKNIEYYLEDRVEGWFGKRFKGPLQPQEVARKAVQAMLKNRKVGVNRTYVPNWYEFALSQEDWKQFEPIVQALGEEVGEVLVAKARDKGFTLLGKPQIVFKVSGDLSQGNLRVNTDIVETKEAKQKLQKEQGQSPAKKQDAFADTLTFNKDDIAKTLLNKGWLLKILTGPDEGKCFRLGKSKYLIGRKPDNDISLNDSNVSRVHAQIEFLNGQYYLADLGSTNGTYLNGRRIVQGQLGPGSHILIGRTEFLIEEG